MQQRQLRLGDILDDYCPRERRLTNHAVVAMVGDDVKQTRCTTCDAEHEYKHAKIPRQRRKNEAPAALYAQVAAGAPKRVTHEQELDSDQAVPETDSETVELMSDEHDDDPVAEEDAAGALAAEAVDGDVDAGAEPVPVADRDGEDEEEEGDNIGN